MSTKSMLVIGAHSEALCFWAGRRLGPGSAGIGSLCALAAQWVLARPWLYWLPASLPFLRLGETIYHKPWPPGPMAASALGVLPLALGADAAEVAGRRRNAERLLGRITEGGALAAVRSLAGAEPGFLRLPVLMRGAGRPPASARDRQLGIMCGYELALGPARLHRARDERRGSLSGCEGACRPAGDAPHPQPAQ